jgi:hypothetical protein
MDWEIGQALRYSGKEPLPALDPTAVQNVGWRLPKFHAISPRILKPAKSPVIMLPAMQVDPRVRLCGRPASLPSDNL